jgi:hypothetical protein
LENCLVSVFEDGDWSRAEEALKREGFVVLRLSGPDVVEPLDGLHEMADASGGGLRILDEVYQELREGSLALIVEVAPEQTAEISQELYRFGAKSVWKLQDWTFVKTEVGEARRER